MLAWMLLLLSSYNPTVPVIEDEVDVIEVNHYHRNGGSKYSQIIFWDQRQGGGDNVVVMYKMLVDKNRNHIKYDKRRRKHLWYFVGKDGMGRSYMCKVYASGFVESHTAVDWELINSEKLPRDFRRGLFRDSFPAYNRLEIHNIIRD
ncbi:MAG: hypothetical protein CMK32_07980 [Porticoccaceae bacterium]|nr:hypothetical protein [Porticoccaceae bacterium]